MAKKIARIISFVVGLVNDVCLRRKYYVLVKQYLSSRKNVQFLANIFTCIGFIFVVIGFLSVGLQSNITNQISIFEMADRCLYTNYKGGDRSSYFSLLDLKGDFMKRIIAGPKLVKIIDQQDMGIHEFYKASETFVRDQIIALCVPNTNCKVREQFDTFDLSNVLDQISYPDFLSRAKATYFLGNKKRYESFDDIEKRKVLEALISRMDEKNENSLLVSKTALDSFDNLVDDFKVEDIFDFDLAMEYWKRKIPGA